METNTHSGMPRTRSKSRLRARKWLIYGVLTGICLTATLYFLLRPATRIPDRVVEQVTYPLYEPTKVPKGYRLLPNSFKANAALVNFRFQNGDRSITVNEQPIPGGFDFENFHQRQLVGAKEVLTPLGPAVIGTFGDNSVISVRTDKTWILVTAPPDVPAAELEQMAKGFQPAA